MEKIKWCDICDADNIRRRWKFGYKAELPHSLLSIDDLVSVMANKQTMIRISGNELNRLFLQDLNERMKWIDDEVGIGGCTIFTRCYHTDEYILYTHGIYWKQFDDGYHDDKFGFMLLSS